MRAMTSTAALLLATSASCSLDIESDDAPIYAAPNDPLVTPDSNAHPQVVSIFRSSGAGGSWCTGTIVASNKVLTAAHCIVSESTPLGNVDVYFTNASESLKNDLVQIDSIYNFTNPTDMVSRLRWDVQSLDLHDSFVMNPLSTDVDIAVLTMASEIPPTLIAPIPLLDPILPSPTIGGLSGLDRWTAYYAAIYGAGDNNSACTGGAPSNVQRYEMEILSVPVGPTGLRQFHFKDSSGWGSKTCGGDSGAPILTTVADYVGSNNIPSGYLISLLSGGTPVTDPLPHYSFGPILHDQTRTYVVQQALDADGDGILAADDNCDHIYNPGQSSTDTDGDGWPDVGCDDDDDNDGIPDYSDNCDTVVNPGQENADGDAAGDACDWDDDGDLIGDESDNCPMIANPGQLNCNAVAEEEMFGNSNGVHLGDACDPVPCASAKPTQTSFNLHSYVPVLVGGQYLCTVSRGRSIRDRIGLTEMIGADQAMLSSNDLELWFCPCEETDAAACALPPWNCELSPTAMNGSQSRWLPLSLVDSNDMSTPLAQPLSASYEPWAYFPNPNATVGWDYNADYQDWVVNQQLWTPTPADPNQFGVGTDMRGMLWVEDSTTVGAYGHNACTGPGCSMASSHLVDVAPDGATEVFNCKKIPEYEPAPWWTYCAVCLETLRFPWEGLFAPALSFLPESVLMFSEAMSRVEGWTPGGGVEVTELFSSQLISQMNDPSALWVGPAEPIETALLPGVARAMGLSADATRLIGQIEIGDGQFTTRSLETETPLSQRAGFAAAYSLRAQTLWVAGGQSRGRAFGELWSFTHEHGWRAMEVDADRAPRAALTATYSSADKHLWFVDSIDGRMTLGRIDTSSGRADVGTVEALERAARAWLLTLVDGNVILVTSNEESYQVTQLTWSARGPIAVTSHSGEGVVASHPIANRDFIGIPISTESKLGEGITYDVLETREFGR